MGGEGIPAKPPVGARLAPAVFSVAALGAVVAFPISEAETAPLALGLIGVVALGLLGGGLLLSPSLVGLAVGLAGVEYVAWLELDGRALDAASPLVAAGLVLAAELAYRSIDGRGPVPSAEGEDARRALTALVVAFAGGVAGLAVLWVADVAPASNLVLGVVAVAAAVAALVLVAVLPFGSTEVDSPGDAGTPR